MIETTNSFSVVMPVYNGSAFIAKAIESCLRQTVLPEEIIIIDDASTDDTAEVVQAFDSPLIKYFSNSENRGPSFSRNRGMQMAACSWILFLDADDIFHPRKIEIISYCISQNRTIHAIGHSFNKAGNIPFEVPDQWYASKQKLKKLSADEVLLKNPMVTPSLAVYAQNGILFNEQMEFAEDHDFILRTAEKFGIWYLDMPLCSLHRLPLTPGGISDNRWKMRKGEMKMYIDYCKRNRIYPAIPFFLVFSLLKHVKNMLFFKN